MSHSSNHQFESGRPSGNSTPIPASFQATGSQGQFISNTRNHRPSTDNRTQYNQYVDGGETTLNQPRPGPVGFQAPQYGGRPSDGHYHQSPAIIGRPQGHHYTVVGQDVHGLINPNSASTNATVPSYHSLAVQGLSRTRGSQSFSQQRPLETRNTLSVQQGFQGQPDRLYMPQVPSYPSPQNSLGNPGMGRGEYGTWRMSSLNPSPGNVAPVVKATEQRFHPTQAIQPGNGRNQGAQYHPNGPYNTFSRLDGTGERLCKDEVPKLHGESLKAVQAGDIQVRRNQPSEGGPKRKRVRFASPVVEESFERIQKRIKVNNHSLPPQRTTGFPGSSMPDQSLRLAFHVDPIPPYQARSRKRDRADSPTDHGEEPAPLPKRQRIQADENQAEFVTRSFGKAQGHTSKASDRRLLPAEEVAPMTFWLRVEIKPRNTQSDTQPGSNRSPDLGGTVLPEDHDHDGSSELTPTQPGNQSPDLGCTVPVPEDHDYDESSGLTRAQYVEMLKPLTQEEIDLSKDNIDDYFSAFVNDYVYQ